MNTPYNLFDDMPGDDLSNPFAELRTMPSGWDLSHLTTRENGRHPQPAQEPEAVPLPPEWKPQHSEHSLRSRRD